MPVQATDHIQELLILVIRFTRARRRVLVNNLRRMDKEGFVPRDLAVQEFTEQLHSAINEHVLHHRLVLRDGPHLRFGARGRIQPLPEIDAEARELLQSDPEAYLRHETQQLAETSLNERLALKMLRRHVQHTLAHQLDRGAEPSRLLPPYDRMTLTDGRMDL